MHAECVRTVGRRRTATLSAFRAACCIWIARDAAAMLGASDEMTRHLTASTDVLVEGDPLGLLGVPRRLCGMDVETSARVPRGWMRVVHPDGFIRDIQVMKVLH